MTTTPHLPVMVERVTTLFDPVPEGWVVDLTLGRAGHAGAILDRRPDLRLLGIDRDPEALVASDEVLARFGDRARTAHARFDQVADVVGELGTRPVVGVLADLGVSSAQLDQPERGFSYHHNGPLDMRMDPTQARTAADVVNDSDEVHLAATLSRFGDERFAVRIARAVVAARPLHSTAELVDVVRAAIPAAARRHGGHPAKRTFQAIRVEVNGELDALTAGLDAALALLAPLGRVGVLSYQSGEDRIVKAALREASTGGCTCPPGLPCGCGATPTVRLLRRGGWTPTADEVAVNPRAASARLRAAEALPGSAPLGPGQPT